MQSFSNSMSGGTSAKSNWILFHLNNTLSKSWTNSHQIYISVLIWVSHVQISIGHFMIFIHGIIYFKMNRNISSVQYELFKKGRWQNFLPLCRYWQNTIWFFKCLSSQIYSVLMVSKYSPQYFSIFLVIIDILVLNTTEFNLQSQSSITL